METGLANRSPVIGERIHRAFLSPLHLCVIGRALSIDFCSVLGEHDKAKVKSQEGSKRLENTERTQLLSCASPWRASGQACDGLDRSPLALMLARARANSGD